jgi:hypothetical protein
MNHMVVIKCLMILFSILVGLPLLIHIDLLCRSRRFYLPTPQPWVLVCNQHVTPLTKDYSCIVLICGRQKILISPGVSNAIALNRSTSSGRSQIPYTKLKFTTYVKIIQYNIHMRLWYGPEVIFTKCRNTKSGFHLHCVDKLGCFI